MAAILLAIITLIKFCYGVYSLPKGCIVSYNHKGEITAVDCSDKNLTSVPTDIPSTVVSLNLRQNVISVIPNNTFKELSVLNDLDLSFNNLSRLEADVFRGLVSLEVLNLARNRINLDKESYPINVFVDLLQLTTLNIQNNTDDITPSTNYPDGAFSRLISLRNLHLDGIPNVPLGEGFDELTNLELLDFSGYGGYCNLPNVSEDMFSNIRTRHPLTLNLSQCAIRYIHPLTFKALPTLKVLDFEDNGDLHFENFMVASQSFSPTLKVLNITTISRGRFLTITGEYFQHLQKTSLSVLIVDGNKAICLDPKAIGYLPQTVTYLSVRNNKLMDAQFLWRVLFMQNIEVLDIGRQIYYTGKEPNMVPSWNSTTSKQKGKEYCKRSIALNTKVKTDNKQQISAQRGSEILYNSLSDDMSNLSSKEDIQDDSPVIWMRNKKQKSGYRLDGGNGIVDEKNFEQNNQSFDTKLDDSFRDDSQLARGRCDTGASYQGFHIDIIPLPPTIHTLIGDNIKFGYAIPNVTFSSPNTVRFLNLSSDLLYCFGGPVYGLHRLQILDLSSNECNDVNPLFFTDMPQLTHLYLQNNKIGESLAADLDGQTFSSQVNLEYLFLDENRIHRLPEKMFMNLVNLKHLVLCDNSLSNVEARIGHMQKLNYLDLSRNQFMYLGEHLRRDLDQISSFSNITVDITGNALLKCTCDTLEFVKWITDTNVKFKNFNKTSCLLKNGSVVFLNKLEDTVNFLWLECNNEKIFITVLILFVCLLFVFGITGALYYKRWRLRYLYYIGRRRVNPYNSLGTPLPVENILDVFISYDEDDRRQRRIVQEELLLKLQEKNISCLISEVHFLCGRNTREIIEEAVLGTRKTLALLTNDFFKSRDRELEFNMAVLHGMETRQELVIPVAMEMLRPENIPPEVRAFLKAYPCLRYQGDDQAFWEELELKINTST